MVTAIRYSVDMYFWPDHPPLSFLCISQKHQNSYILNRSLLHKVEFMFALTSQSYIYFRQGEVFVTIDQVIYTFL